MAKILNVRKSGYIQKKCVKKVEDCRTYDDGTVRDINGAVQFLYGGDGFNAKELIPCNGLEFPFFCNPYLISSTLNSEAEYEAVVADIGSLRVMNKEEVELLCSFIQAGCPGVQTEITERSTFNIRLLLKTVLKKVEIYESKIPQFCRAIKDEFEEAKAKGGFMAGLVSASSIGEPTTQLSTVGELHIPLLLKLRSGKKEELHYNGPIGEFIDEMLKKCQLIYHLGPNSVASIPPPDVDVYVNTVDPLTSKTSWKKIQEISRHPAGGNLVRVTTKSRRIIDTTLSHSHLKRCPKTGNIIPIRGDKLKVGDFIPVCCKMNNNEGTIKHIKVEGKIYPLDFDVGWFFGAYLSEGHINNGQIGITNISKHFEKRCKSFAKRFDGKCRKYEKEGSIYGSEKLYPGITHYITGLNDLGRYLGEECGRGSENKSIPAFAFFAPDKFVGGLLRGYFDGDGNVNEERQLIRVCSISRNLIETVALLLSRFGIFGSISTETKTTQRAAGKNEQPLISYIILRKHAQLFLENVGSDFPEKLAAIKGIIAYNNRENVHSNREDIDLVPDIGETISNAARPLKLPGYSRLYKRQEKKKYVGKETLRKYVKLFEESGAEGKEMEMLKKAVDSDIIWDQIISLEILEDPGTLMYDIGVTGNHTFMMQSGILTHNTLNSFHSTGMSAKDVTLGVPKLKEVLNATKNPSKPTCTIQLNDREVKKYTEIETSTTATTEEKENAAKDALIKVTEIANSFTYLNIEYFMKDYELLYLSSKSKGKATALSSPLGLITYEMYEKKWWVKLAEDFGNKPSFEPDGWVILIQLDINKLYTYGITPQDIARCIENETTGAKGDAMACIASPTNIGEIEVYLNFSEIRQFTSNHINTDEPSADNRVLITEDNIDYFTTREVALNMIKKAKVQGINGITKTYVRQDVKTKEWFVDTQGTNLITILSMVGVDIAKTNSDDIWEVYNVLGIEAVRAFLIEEITKILSFDGTYINPRHISLLVDTMCRTGIITSVNRDGISRDVGPIAKGMFEKAVDNFAEACAFGEYDGMKGVSAAVMYGTLPEVGTGTITIKDSEKLPAVRRPPVKLPTKKRGEAALSKK